MKNKIQEDVIGAVRNHPVFIPITRLECSYGKISSPPTMILEKTEISGTYPARHLQYNTIQYNSFINHS